MIQLLDAHRYDRQFRLFAVACCRTEWENLHRYQQRVIDLSEAVADGLADPAALSTAAEELDRIGHIPNEQSDLVAAVRAAAALRCTNSLAAAQSYRAVPDLLAHLSLRRRGLEHLAFQQQLDAQRDYRTQLAHLLRDITGNPFRPVIFSPEWRTSTTVAIARGMYESRDFSPMPILADALQDAGCENDDILIHCRDPQQVHVRGCWVVDLVLDKS